MDISSVNLKFSVKNERKVTKVLLLARFYQLFSELSQNRMHCNQFDSSMEYYMMDNKIIQLLIQGIVETGEYTLEGIACYTRIPFDVIYDAASGIRNHLSVAPWARIANLYIQVNPDIVQALINDLLEMRKKEGSNVLPP